MTREWENAVRSGDLEELQRLLANGADVDARNRRNQTALMLAASEGSYEVVEWLLKNGAATDRTAKYGLSALMLATVRGHASVVRALADAGADARLRGTGAPGFAGKTALDLARDRGDQAIADILDPFNQSPRVTNRPTGT